MTSRNEKQPRSVSTVSNKTTTTHTSIFHAQKWSSSTLIADGDKVTITKAKSNDFDLLLCCCCKHRGTYMVFRCRRYTFSSTCRRCDILMRFRTPCRNRLQIQQPGKDWRMKCEWLMLQVLIMWCLSGVKERLQRSRINRRSSTK